jgi:hypothetical protein
MADEERGAPAESAPESEGPPRTPFDHPAFLPVLLWGFTAWFAWDIVTDAPAYREYPNFNRYGLGFATAVAVYATSQALRPWPFAPAAFWGAVALGLGFLGFVGRGWYSEAPVALAFNRCGFAAAALLALFFGLRAHRRAQRASG